MQRLCKQQKSTGFWQAADKQINVRRQAIGNDARTLRAAAAVPLLLWDIPAPFSELSFSESCMFEWQRPFPYWYGNRHKHNRTRSRRCARTPAPRSRGGSGPRRRVATMMPVAAPKVLMRPPGQRQFEWVDMWEAYVSGPRGLRPGARSRVSSRLFVAPLHGGSAPGTAAQRPPACLRRGAHTLLRLCREPRRRSRGGADCCSGSGGLGAQPRGVAWAGHWEPPEAGRAGGQPLPLGMGAPRCTTAGSGARGGVRRGQARS